MVVGFLTPLLSSVDEFCFLVYFSFCFPWWRNMVDGLGYGSVWTKVGLFSFLYVCRLGGLTLFDFFDSVIVSFGRSGGGIRCSCLHLFVFVHIECFIVQFAFCLQCLFWRQVLWMTGLLLTSIHSCDQVMDGEWKRGFGLWGVWHQNVCIVAMGGRHGLFCSFPLVISSSFSFSQLSCSQPSFFLHLYDSALLLLMVRIDFKDILLFLFKHSELIWWVLVFSGQCLCSLFIGIFLFVLPLCVVSSFFGFVLIRAWLVSETSWLPHLYLVYISVRG